MKYSAIKTISAFLILLISAPTISIAQPAGPGGGDPFATPVNGGVALVAVIAFVYGSYRIYQLAKRNSAGNDNV